MTNNTIMTNEQIDMALIIAGYCAILLVQEDKETAPDCSDMLAKYKRAAKRYKIPHDEEGYIDTEMVYEELDTVAKRICKNVD